MKIKVITISGKEDPSSEKLFVEYFRRLQHYIPVEKISLKTSRKKNIAEQKNEEAIIVLRQVSKNDELILLDEGGKELSSVQLSEFLRRKMNASKNICFAIGSAFGFDEELKKKIFIDDFTFKNDLAPSVGESDFH